MRLGQKENNESALTVSRKVKILEDYTNTSKEKL